MPKKLLSILSLSAAMCLGFADHQTLSAQENQKNVMVVFDGSGSMWGRINGRPKIEIARETLSQVLSETTNNMNMGMIAYGHRQKAKCSDIETIVRAGPSQTTVPAMINAANAIQPKGKTPLSDAVRIAAEELKYTENEATVVLVTDGIETCDADPCALASELERLGINFTAHVVGFGLSRDEGRQIACLADNTGGKYFPADDADGLKDALEETFAALPDDDDFEDAIVARNVRFVFRDTQDGDQIGIRQLSAELKDGQGNPISGGDFKLAYPEASGNSATATLMPGEYIISLNRAGLGQNAGYAFDFSFSVPEGEGVHVIEANLAASLIINPMINPALRFDKGDPFETAVAGSRPRFNYRIFAIRDGRVNETPVVDLVSDSHPNIPLPPGKYLVQGNIDSGTSVERVVDVAAGRETRFDFSFDATRVYVEKRGGNGALISNKSAYFYDGAPYDVKGWVKGYVTSSSGARPFYLPTGTWGLFVGGAQKMITVPGDYRDLYITINEGEKMSDKDRNYLIDRPDACAEILKVRYGGCLLQKAELGFGSLKPGGRLSGLITPKPKDISSSHPLFGLGGTAYVFTDLDQEPKAYVVFDDPNFGGDALVILGENWCGQGNCAGRRIRVEQGRLDKLKEDGFLSGKVSERDFSFGYDLLGEGRKTLYVTPNGQRRSQFDFFDTIILSESSQSGNSDTEIQKAAADTAPPLPLKEEFAAFSGVFASIGFESKLPATGLVPFCSSKPILLTENGILTFKRFQQDRYVTEETRFCSKHESGEIDCHIVPVSTDGKRADIRNSEKGGSLISLRNYDPVSGTAESCLAGPAGRDGPRLCTNIQACSKEVLQVINPRVFTSVFDAPRFEGQ